MSITVPLGVARTVVASAWAAGHSGDATLLHFTRITGNPEARYVRTVRLNATADAQAVLDALTVVLAELEQAGAKQATVTPVRDCRDQVWHVVEELRERDERRAAEQQRQKQDSDEQARRSRTKRRERTMAGVVEMGRHNELREIAEDYGLNITDPQVRAALTAAFHLGAYHIVQVSNALLFGEVQELTPDEVESLITQNKKLFDSARSASEKNDASVPPDSSS